MGTSMSAVRTRSLMQRYMHHEFRQMLADPGLLGERPGVFAASADGVFAHSLTALIRPLLSVSRSLQGREAPTNPSTADNRFLQQLSFLGRIVVLLLIIVVVVVVSVIAVVAVVFVIVAVVVVAVAVVVVVVVVVLVVVTLLETASSAAHALFSPRE
ncbi:unnamed protein product [Polarella glacialis]|uniref:Uncharacterized protein n=1 Tax=Polarella glacialis TaxID=89957 RepID=A0A813KN70_POLGL|nr:unnamed protein product [Polarella glacialis]